MNRTFDRTASILFMMAGVFFIVESRKLSATAYGSNIGPDLFPFSLGIILVLLSIRLMIETFRYPAGEKQPKPNGLAVKRFAIIFASAIGYAFLLEPIGYVLATFLFLVIAFQAMEKGSWVSALAVSGFFSVGVYYIYVELLKGTLPGFPF
ncbi:tripartite tricarboxylate transporter TctB family protein [Paenactinomyces guangxiensis]|uniref:Tripartite tricarboxylate transporter TctB family protein n=1 Tax=Paenactinomyces guangxiensis TaxID=1490290 RepID=A0A7W2A805_9BACL|nr:tripartite tricarboxylate transporter TctB family protein [Paenactinomyces guangxiensis]MBA4493667.1 tripartite tricarboxylate transporter TctB family protein [Paenactinomyces guangxiensis]MBH8590954.1 tripartite tricarboxylate transporter TctB family protein [Paenactinomyces guangxiensis]